MHPLTFIKLVIEDLQEVTDVPIPICIEEGFDIDLVRVGVEDLCGDFLEEELARNVSLLDVVCIQPVPQ